MHGAIAAHFPELAPLAQWHHISLDGPLHYFANAKYCWDMLQGRVERGNYDPDPADAFANAVVLGAVAGDRMPRFEQDWSEVRVWLEDRLPELMGNFVAEMERIDALE